MTLYGITGEIECYVAVSYSVDKWIYGSKHPAIKLILILLHYGRDQFAHYKDRINEPAITSICDPHTIEGS